MIRPVNSLLLESSRERLETSSGGSGALRTMGFETALSPLSRALWPASSICDTRASQAGQSMRGSARSSSSSSSFREATPWSGDPSQRRSGETLSSPAPSSPPRPWGAVVPPRPNPTAPGAEAGGATPSRPPAGPPPAPPRDAPPRDPRDEYTGRTSSSCAPARQPSARCPGPRPPALRPTPK